MEVVAKSEPVAFKEAAGVFFRHDPLSTSVIGTYVDGVLAGSRPSGPDDLWLLLTEGERVAGVAMHTPPHNLFLPRLEPGLAASLAAFLAAGERQLSGVSGEALAVREFAAAWIAKRGGDKRVRTAMRLYRLGELVAPSGVAGEPRLAGAEDGELVERWSRAFHDEAQPGSPHNPAGAEGRLRARELWLWCHEGEAVALAGSSQPASRVARVGPVYTPPERRRQGFGSAVTAAATTAALEAGAVEVVLYTDLANPTSNAIYQEIGFVADHDAEEIDFLVA